MGTAGDAADPRDPEHLAARYGEVRATSERLAEPLSPEDCAIQSMTDASPTKWHLAHTSWYFETFVLESAIAGYQPFDARFRVLFNSYYNSVGEQYERPKRGMLSRPSFEEVCAYRRHVDERILALLEAGTSLDPALADIFVLGLHHEQQHQELILTDVKHMLSINPLRPAYRKTPVPPRCSAPALRWTRYDEAMHEIGHDGGGFAFDNEGPRHRVFLQAFDLASRPVTNGEFLDFIDDGGYQQPDAWLSDGWAAVQREGWRGPLYWESGDDTRRMLTLGGLREIRAEEPVCHVSFYEADAYARWAGARLPSEHEWEIATANAPIEGNFLESDLLHPAAAGETTGNFAQLFGDVWEWTRSAYAPYPGYRPPAGALGEYNGKFMSNQMTLRGSSCATSQSHVRASYRNFFYPTARWQFSGFRLARDAR
jgi:ergothioneine biosynthesis protein EgtB